jgi:hypothetical protein
MSDTTNPERDPYARRPIVNWVIGGSVLLLLVIALVGYNAEQNDAEAAAKADELIGKLHAAGLRVPVKPDTIITTLGHDGGAVCEDPGSALKKALLDTQITNGASFVGQRPIRASVNVLRGAALVIETYCPEELEAFRDRVKDYKTDDTVKE